MFMGEKPAKLAPILAKINPVCTSHTDRAYGVDVLQPRVAQAASAVWRVSLTLISLKKMK
jgi:hypothetical protein